MSFLNHRGHCESAEISAWEDVLNSSRKTCKVQAKNTRRSDIKEDWLIRNLIYIIKTSLVLLFARKLLENIGVFFCLFVIKQSQRTTLFIRKYHKRKKPSFNYSWRRSERHVLLNFSWERLPTVTSGCVASNKTKQKVHKYLMVWWISMCNSLWKSWICLFYWRGTIQLVISAQFKDQQVWWHERALVFLVWVTCTWGFLNDHLQMLGQHDAIQTTSISRKLLFMS